MFVPSREAVESLLKLTESCIEGAAYFCKRFQKIVVDQKLMDQYKGFLAALNQNFLATVKEQYSITANPMAGETVPTSREAAVNAQRVHMPHTTEGALTFNIISQPGGKIDRSYQRTDGKAASHESYAYLDFLFQQWMVKNNIERKGDMMYGFDADGGKINLSADDLKKRMADPEKGFGKYVKEETSGRYGIEQVTTSIAVAPSKSASEQEEPTAPGADVAASGGGMRGG